MNISISISNLSYFYFITLEIINLIFREKKLMHSRAWVLATVLRQFFIM